MPIIPHQPNLLPIGHFDFLDSQTDTIRGGEVLVFDEIVPPTGDNSSADVFDEGSKRSVVRLATTSDRGPFFFADNPDGSLFNGNNFEVSGKLGVRTPSRSQKPSGKVGIYNQEAFYVVSSNVVDSSTVNASTSLGTKLFVDANGHLTTTVSDFEVSVGFFIEFQQGDLLRQLPPGFHYNTTNKIGDSIIVYKSDRDGYAGATPAGGDGGVVTYNLVSTNYNANLDDVFIAVDASSGPVTISLPFASSLRGKKFYVKKVDTSSNLVIVAPSGADTIDNNTGFQWSVPYGNYAFVADGSTQWWVA